MRYGFAEQKIWKQMWRFHIADRWLSNGCTAQSIMIEILPYILATQKSLAVVALPVKPMECQPC